MPNEGPSPVCTQVPQGFEHQELVKQRHHEDSSQVMSFSCHLRKSYSPTPPQGSPQHIQSPLLTLRPTTVPSPITHTGSDTQGCSRAVFHVEVSFAKAW